MKWTIADNARAAMFLAQVERISEQRVADCYQCGKCSGGCPVTADAHSGPSHVMRQVQLGLHEEALANDLVWNCAGCNTCSSRCPEGIDTARVMDAVRAIALHEESSLNARSEKVRVFYRAFLDSVRDFGRLSEVGLMGGYNINSGRVWTNMAKAPWFLFKGKIGMTAHQVKNLDRLERVFRRVRDADNARIAKAAEAPKAEGH